MNEVPVLLIIFNRPDKVRALMDRISETKPSKLFIAADGPRANIESDKERCAEARRIATEVDWPCEVSTLFQEKNLGVDKGMETAIGWFFSNVAEGVICEDDCIPHVDFFRFAAELLKKYRDDPKVSMICGTNFQEKRTSDASYYFSRYPTWGYAIWKRSWESFDLNLSSLDDFVKEKKIDAILQNKDEKKYWLSFFRKIKSGKFSFMDTRIMYGMWNVGGACIIPQENLIKNIGFDQEATHATVGKNITTIETRPLGNIVHPPHLEIDHRADSRFFDKIHRRSFLGKVLHKAVSVYKTLISS